MSLTASDRLTAVSNRVAKSDPRTAVARVPDDRTERLRLLPWACGAWAGVDRSRSAGRTQQDCRVAAAIEAIPDLFARRRRGTRAGSRPLLACAATPAERSPYYGLLGSRTEKPQPAESPNPINSRTYISRAAMSSAYGKLTRTRPNTRTIRQNSAPKNRPKPTFATLCCRFGSQLYPNIDAMTAPIAVTTPNSSEICGFRNGKITSNLILNNGRTAATRACSCFSFSMRLSNVQIPQLVPRGAIT
jgi:hypothetical protein